VSASLWEYWVSLAKSDFVIEQRSLVSAFSLEYTDETNDYISYQLVAHEVIFY